MLLYSLHVSRASYIGSFVFSGYSPVRAFGAWMSAVKRFRRADEFWGYFAALTPSINAGRYYEPRALFSMAPEEWHSQHGDPIRHDIGRQAARAPLSTVET